MTLGERIKKVRRELDLTQQKFAEQIGTTANVLTNYETGLRSPSAAAFNNICKTFNISETWLRTGEGEMFLQISREDALAAAVNKLLSGESSKFKTRLITILANLGPQEWDILESYALKLVQDTQSSDKVLEQEAQEKAAKKAAFRKMVEEQYDSQEEPVSQALSANGQGVG